MYIDFNLFLLYIFICFYTNINSIEANAFRVHTNPHQLKNYNSKERGLQRVHICPSCSNEHDAELLSVRLFVEVVRVSMLIASNEAAIFSLR
jgi:hypothetical protein